MARKVVYVDDFDGSDIGDGEGGPVRFSLNDEWFELDLSSKNFAKLEKVLQPWMDKATSVEAPRPEPAAGRRGRSPGVAKRTQVPGKGKDYLDAVRRWARENGHQVADRGRIAASIQEAYEDAHRK